MRNLLTCFGRVFRAQPLAVAALFASVMVAATMSRPHAAEDDEPPLAPPGATDASDEDDAAKPRPWHAPLNEFGFTGSLRGAYWSSNRRLDDEQDVGVASTWLKLDKRLVPGFSIFAEGYLADEDVFGEQRDTSRLREAYLNGRSGAWDFRIGKQIIAWGRADRFNPTDNLTPRDFTLLAPEVDEDRFGSEAARATWALNSRTSLTGIWIAHFRPNVVALPPVPGVSYQENVPDSSRQWASKLDQSGGDVDWSVSYFDGFDLNPDLSLAGTAGATTVVALDHHRIKVIGADAATTRGQYRLAAEAAYTRTEDTEGIDPTIKNPFIYLVIGVERDFGNNLDLIVQAFYRQVENYSDPEQIADPAVRALAVQAAVASNQYDRSQSGLTVRISKKWLNETLEGELAGAAILNRDGYLLRPKLSYAVSDSLKLITGIEYFQGSNKTSYGLLENNRTVFAEMRYFF